MTEKIPFSKPYISIEEINAVVSVMESGWLTIGPKVRQFEDDLKNMLESPNVVAVDSCTSALTLSMKALPKDKEKPIALVPALTFVATANAAYHAGYQVEFCDVGADGNIDPNSIIRTYDLIVPVHFAGQVCDLESLYQFTDNIIEDAAHAVGAIYQDKYLGLSQYSKGACFSFYPTKNMTTVEGGAFISNDESLVESIRRMSLHGLGSSHIDRYNRSSLSKPIVELPGYKANMTDIEAAIGIEQLKNLFKFIGRRTDIAKYYKERLSGKVDLLEDNGRDHVHHIFVILVNNRDEIVKKLTEHFGVGIHYSPIIPEHPFYKTDKEFPVAKYISEHCISLPLYPKMTDSEVEFVVERVKEIL